MPSCGTSRSRNVRRKSRRHAALSTVERAVNRPRESAAQPGPIQRGDADLVQRQARQLVEGDAAGQRLRALAEQLRRGAAEHEEPGRPARPVGEDTKRRKQIRPSLDLVEHDEAPEVAERQFRIGQPGHVGGPLEVEHGGARRRRGDLPGERRLADLPRAEERHHGIAGQQPPDGVDVRRSGNHVVHNTMKFGRDSSNFQYYVNSPVARHAACRPQAAVAAHAAATLTRSAATGRGRAWRRASAGYTPKTRPTDTDTTNARTIDAGVTIVDQPAKYPTEPREDDADQHARSRRRSW